MRTEFSVDRFDQISCGTSRKSFGMHENYSTGATLNDTSVEHRCTAIL